MAGRRGSEVLATLPERQNGREGLGTMSPTLYCPSRFKGPKPDSKLQTFLNPYSLQLSKKNAGVLQGPPRPLD